MVDMSARRPERVRARVTILRVAAITVALATSPLDSIAYANPVAEFYRGRTVDFIVGAAAGGGFDQTARPIAAHLSKHLPGNPTIVVRNMPGGAGIIMTNFLVSAAPSDGSVIGMGTVHHCNELIDDALAKGAKLACGGKADTTLMPATVLDHVENRRKRLINGQMTGNGVKFATARIVKLGKEWLPVTVSADTDQRASASGWTPGNPVFSADLGTGTVTVQVKRIPNGYRLSYRGVVLDAHVFTAREAELAKRMPEKVAADTSKKLLCPMPGLVKLIQVSEGQEVKAGEPLAIVEAMKMENVLRAERDVTVKKIHASEGDSLPVDATIMEFV
jgi:acetyl/propionyl-CoA carboxylase alpha subunit